MEAFAAILFHLKLASQYWGPARGNWRAAYVVKFSERVTSQQNQANIKNDCYAGLFTKKIGLHLIYKSLMKYVNLFSYQTDIRFNKKCYLRVKNLFIIN
jgi:hypothetical protein